MPKYPPIEMIDVDNAKCSKCKEIKHISKFQRVDRKDKKSAYYVTYCYDCRRVQLYNNLSNNFNQSMKIRFSKFEKRCISSNILCTITLDDFINLYSKQDGKCFYMGIDLNTEHGNGLAFDSISIDKIIPELGYILSNVVLCSVKANTIKNNLTVAEIKEWIPKFYNKLIEGGYINE